MVNQESGLMTESQIDTIILAAYASKQEVTISLRDGNEVSGFIHSDFDEDGFSLTSTYVWWKDIQFVQPNPEFYNEWSEVFKNLPDPFSKEGS